MFLKYGEIKVRILPPQPRCAKDLNFGLSPCFLIIIFSSNVTFPTEPVFQPHPNFYFQVPLFFNNLIWFESSLPFGIIFYHKSDMKSLERKVIDIGDKLFSYRHSNFFSQKPGSCFFIVQIQKKGPRFSFRRPFRWHFS